MKKSDVLVQAVIKIARFGNEVGQALQDGKIQFAEIIGFMDNIIGFWTVVQNWPEIKLIWPEYKNDPVKRAELIEVVKAELNLPNEKVEEIIEQGFDVIDQMYEFIMAFRG